MSRALLTGITGQDGSYLAELLLERGYEVHGVVRPAAEAGPERLRRIEPLLERITLHTASLERRDELLRVFLRTEPTECYHLAAQSVAAAGTEEAAQTLETNVQGTRRVLSCLREAAPACRFVFAASSEMFGDPTESPQTESTPFRPRSPYGVSKVAGFDLTRTYRETHGLHASSAILFNHESPRRGRAFVTRKISSAAAAIKLGRATELRLGNLDARRDWGFAGDYVDALARMLQQDRPDDYVIATGVDRSVRDFARAAFAIVDLDWKAHVVVDERFFREAEAVPLVGDASKAARLLDWSPTVGFEALVRRMVEADLARLEG